MVQDVCSAGCARARLCPSSTSPSPARHRRHRKKHHATKKGKGRKSGNRWCLALRPPTTSAAVPSLAPLWYLSSTRGVIALSPQHAPPPPRAATVLTLRNTTGCYHPSPHPTCRPTRNRVQEDAGGRRCSGRCRCRGGARRGGRAGTGCPWRATYRVRRGREKKASGTKK